MGKMKEFIQRRKEKWAEFKKDYRDSAFFLETAGSSVKLGAGMAAVGAAAYFVGGAGVDVFTHQAAHLNTVGEVATFLGGGVSFMGGIITVLGGGDFYGHLGTNACSGKVYQ